MNHWGWSGSGAKSDVAASVVALAKRRGLDRSESARGASVFVHVTSSGDGRVLVIGSGIAGDDVARELSRTFAADARYVEVELSDSEAAASARDVGADGVLGAEEDLDELVTETCEEWFEGKKYRSEAIDDLVALCLGFEDGVPTDGVELRFRRGSSARVVALLDAVRGGARWEKIVIAGRDAIRVYDENGARTSFLDASELSQFQDGLEDVPVA